MLLFYSLLSSMEVNQEHDTGTVGACLDVCIVCLCVFVCEEKELTDLRMYSGEGNAEESDLADHPGVTVVGSSDT